MNFHSADVLFCSKSGDGNCEAALAFLRQNCANVTACMGDWDDELPSAVTSWAGDYILSFMSKWIIPSSVLARARVCAVNFHPAPPSRPGAAGVNYALYDGDGEFGVTCHYMTAKVDSGRIIAARKFPVYESDSVASLLKRSHENLLGLFIEMVTLLANSEELPESGETWNRDNFHKRSDLNENLRRIPADVSRDEFERRLRATVFEGWKPYVVLHGVRFYME